MYNHDEYKDVPVHILDDLDRYSKDGGQLGGFLSAVVSNDLQGAVGHADPEAMQALKQIATYVNCQLHTQCHGSAECVWLWRGH